MDEVIDIIYPVDSLYITTSTATTCPLAAIITGSTWQLIAQDLCLQCSNAVGDAGKTIEAGLPNITGQVREVRSNSEAVYAEEVVSGAFYGERLNRYSSWGGGGGWNGCEMIKMDASKGNAIYGKSSTVQPPTYIVNVWKRTK